MLLLLLLLLLQCYVSSIVSTHYSMKVDSEPLQCTCPALFYQGSIPYIPSVYDLMPPAPQLPPIQLRCSVNIKMWFAFISKAWLEWLHIRRKKDGRHHEKNTPPPEGRSEPQSRGVVSERKTIISAEGNAIENSAVDAALYSSVHTDQATSLCALIVHTHCTCSVQL